MKREKSIKILKIFFKYNFTIKWPKNAIIIMTMISMIFQDFFSTPPSSIPTFVYINYPRP